MLKGEKLMKQVNVALYGYLLIVLSLCTNMGESRKVNTIGYASFHQLREREGCYHATIHDDGSIVKVRNFSFTGYTSLGGILRETDDSVNRLEIAQVKEIIILNRFHISERYKNQELLLAQVVTTNNSIIDNLLIPRHVEISGVETTTQIQKAWKLSSIDKIEIEGPCQLEAQAQKKSEPILQKEATAPILVKEATAPAELSSTLPDLQEDLPPTYQHNQPPQNHQGVWAAITNLFTALFDVFKAFFRAFLTLFGLH